jgi:hypothetical protein
MSHSKRRIEEEESRVFLKMGRKDEEESRLF